MFQEDTSPGGRGRKMVSSRLSSALKVVWSSLVYMEFCPPPTKKVSKVFENSLGCYEVWGHPELYSVTREGWRKGRRNGLGWQCKSIVEHMPSMHEVLGVQPWHRKMGWEGVYILTLVSEDLEIPICIQSLDLSLMCSTESTHININVYLFFPRPKQTQAVNQCKD